MKTLLNILFFLGIMPFIGAAQTPPCQTCACILKRARETKDFEESIKQFNSARNNCPPEQTAAIDAEIIGVFKKINDLKNKAEKSQKDLKIALENANKETIRANQKTDEAEREKKNAEQQTTLAKRTARQAKSKELAANALMAFSRDKNTEGGKDETVALRLAYTALNIDTSKGVQDVFDKIIFNADNQFYQVKITGNISRFNRDSSRFLTFDEDNTRVTDWTGKIYNTLKGDVSGFNRDSSRFWTYDRDSTRVTDWTGKIYNTLKGYVRGFNCDSSRFWTYDEDSTRLTDWTGKIYNTLKGNVRGFNRDSSRFLTYDEDSTRVTDWTGKIYNTLKGNVSGFNRDSSRF